MKKTGFIFVAMLCICSVSASAQDLKSILSGVAKTLVGDKATTESSIVGTWNYVGADCQFESDDLLSQAGGAVAAKTIEEKMTTFYQKVGLTTTSYTFNSDGTYSAKMGKATTSGTYTFDSEKKTVTMKSRLGISSTAYVVVTGSSMSLVYEANKLLSALKTVTSLTSKLNTNAALINTLASQYEGLRLGYELKKAESAE